MTWAATGVLLSGFALSASLIVAIGAQNAFVLRQGLVREHVAAVALFCAASDALLMSAGVLGMGQALEAVPALARAMTLIGALFLAVYGAIALRRAWHPGALHAAGAQAPRRSRTQVLAQAAAFTFLNPHVYLDTMLLVGSVGAQQPPALRAVFLAGACAASVAWFFGLAYGARRLAPWFARPGAWRVLDALIGLTMWVLAALLLRSPV